MVQVGEVGVEKSREFARRGKRQVSGRMTAGTGMRHLDEQLENQTTGKTVPS